MSLPALPAATIEQEILRESLRRRWQMGMHTILPFLGLSGAVGFTLYGEVPSQALAAWLGAVATMLLVRCAQGLRMARTLAVASHARLRRQEHELVATSVLMNAALAGGLWLVGLPGDEQVRAVVTLACCLYAVSLLAYQAIEFRGYAAGLAFNLGQAVLFWALTDRLRAHWLIAAMLAVLACTAIHQARLTSQRFRSSVIDGYRRQGLAMQLASEKRAVEAALRAARDASQSKSSFMAAASHDLRQPIHALSLFVQTLAPTLRQSDQCRLMDRIRDTTVALETLFTSFLDLSRLDADAVSAQSSTFDLQALARRLADEFAPQAATRGLSFGLCAPCAWTHTDGVLLERVLRNLLSNGLRHTARGSLSLAIEPAGPQWRVVVSDTGDGIAPADQARIFGEFVRGADAAREGRRAGFGLGLAIVRRIDRLLGLDLRLDSEPGQGSRFRLTVPRVAPRCPATEPLACSEAGWNSQAVQLVAAAA